MVIGERLLDAISELPRWYELSRTQKTIAVIGAAAGVAVLAGLLVTATIRDTSSQQVAASPQQSAGGIASCSRGTSPRADLPIMQAAIGNLGALPHRANLAEIVSSSSSTGINAVALVCTVPGSDVSTLEDIGSALAYNINAARTAGVAALTVRDIGDGDAVNMTIETSLPAHTFTAAHDSPSNRAAWRVVPSEN